MEAGFANKIIGVFAEKICISWDSSKAFFPKEKVVLTGNPIRKFSIFNFQFSIDKKLPIIYVTGGSSGSHFINVLIEGCIENLLKKFNVIHQTGDAKSNDYDRLKNLRDNLPSDIRKRYILEKFIDPSHIGSVLKNCDLVICRSGMNTVSELIYFNKPGILIPLPFSQGGEQLKNAKFLENLGLSRVIVQKETDSKKLYENIVSMSGNIIKYKLKKLELGIMQNEAAKNIVRIIEYVYREKKGTQI